jgi:hypothetical protein
MAEFSPTKKVQKKAHPSDSAFSKSQRSVHAGQEVDGRDVLRVLHDEGQRLEAGLSRLGMPGGCGKQGAHRLPQNGGPVRESRAW